MSGCCDNFKLEEYIEQFDMSSSYMRGPAGPQGPQGDPGAAATVEVGTTTTGAAGSDAEVTNSGTSSAAVLNFVIPKGDEGDPGEGVPSGGTPFQVLLKKSSADYDTEWSDALLNAMPHDTASGSIASFPDGADEAPVKDLVCAINPVQSLNGYDNPWPAGGGKNILPISTRTGGEVNYVTWTNNNDGSWTANGTASGGNSYASGTTLLVSLGALPAGEYTVTAFSTDKSTPNDSFFVRIGVGDNATFVASAAGKCTFTADGSSVYCVGLSVSNGTTVNNATCYLQAEKGATNTTWEPYSNICPITGHAGLNVYVSPTQDSADATVYPIFWNTEAGTVYCGNLDATTGILTVTWGLVDLASFTWTSTSNGRFNTNAAVTNIKSIPNNTTAVSAICSSLPVRAINDFSSANTGVGIGMDYSSNKLRARFSPITDTPTGMFVYELATPVTYQLTPTQVNSLLGQNNVWHDANGETTVEYYADTTLYIEKKITAAIAAALNS